VGLIVALEWTCRLSVHVPIMSEVTYSVVGVRELFKVHW